MLPAATPALTRPSLASWLSIGCFGAKHMPQAVTSAVCLVVFIAVALLLNMSEVEVNPASKRMHALGHSGAEVMVFATKVRRGGLGVWGRGLGLGQGQGQGVE